MKKLIFKIKLLSFILFSLTIASQNLLAQNNNSDNTEELYKNFKTEFMWEAKVNIAGMINVGESKRGTRRVIPITGGTFSGPKIKGEVLPGGEDWQLVRPDGDTELYARYLMKTEDGVVFQIINRALIHMPTEGENKEPYIKSVIDLEAPSDSKYAYLNHAIFLGTLTVPPFQQGVEPYVIIKVYKVL